jgi:hypothetical protein
MSEPRTTNLLLTIIAAFLALITLRLYGDLRVEQVYATDTPASSASTPIEILVRSPMPVQAQEAPIPVALYYRDQYGSWKPVVGTQGVVPTARYAQ